MPVELSVTWSNAFVRRVFPDVFRDARILMLPLGQLRVQRADLVPREELRLSFLHT